MSNIIREIFVEDHVQVSTNIKETLRDLNARDFKICMSQAPQWHVWKYSCSLKSVSYLLHMELASSENHHKPHNIRPRFNNYSI